MRSLRVLAPLVLAVLLAVLLGVAGAPFARADGFIAGAQASPAPAPGSIVIIGPSGHPAAVTADEIAGLPRTHLDVSFATEHGPHRGSFEGPLLWTLLVHAGAIDPAKPRQQAAETVLISGSDGYVAAIALGEISPAFEGKQVILAESEDGRALGPEHFRITVPGDQHGGRAVRDVVRIAVTMPAPTQH